MTAALSECRARAEPENPAPGKEQRWLSGKADREKGSLPTVPVRWRDGKWAGSRSRSRIPCALDHMPMMQQWHPQGSMNGRERDSSANSLAMHGGRHQGRRRAPEDRV